MLRAPARPCISNRKIKARIGSYFTYSNTHTAERAHVRPRQPHTRAAHANTNKSIINVSETQARRTVLFVREGGWRHSYKRGRGCVGAASQFTVARRVVRPDAGPPPARRRHPEALRSTLDCRTLCPTRAPALTRPLSRHLLQTKCYNSCLYHWSVNLISEYLLDRFITGEGEFCI